jgi:hypothetical protein
VATDRGVRWGKWRIPVCAWVIFPTAILLAPQGAAAQDTASFYSKNCGAWHSTGGGPRVGPDLKDVSTHRDRAWLFASWKIPKL